MFIRLESRYLNENYINGEGRAVSRLNKKIENTIWIFVLICAISYLISSYRVYKGKEIIPNILGLYGFTVSTGSMEPTIKTGDYLISRKIKSDDIKVGDIITFIEEDTIITHRVSEIITNQDEETMFITKGDGNNVEDDTTVMSENIISKYIFKIPMIGYALDYFKYMNQISKVGILLLMCLIYLNIDKKKSKISKEEYYEEGR